MKDRTANSRRAETPGEVGPSPKRESLASRLNLRWRKLGYYTVIAASPAVLLSNLQGALADESQQTQPNVAGQPLTRVKVPNRRPNLAAWLRRRSQFRLPHHLGGLDQSAALAGTDDCPGRAIPGGQYTAAAPFVDSGDTSGANNTVRRVHYYYYESVDVNGPDHVYSFTLSGHGANPQIRITATSPTYRPVVYLLYGGYAGACPGGTGNDAYTWEPSYSDASGTVTINGATVPHVPFYLFIDSRETGPEGAGPYTIRMQDMTVSSAVCPNPIDCAEFLVHQHYLDFLGRWRDDAGLAFWSDQINSCGGDPACVDHKRQHVSAAFFLSPEFQETGFFVIRIQRVAFGRRSDSHASRLSLQQFFDHAASVRHGFIDGQPGSAQVLEQNKQSYATRVATSSDFNREFPLSLTAAQFVDELFNSAGVVPTPSERQAAEAAYGSSNRVAALRSVADSQSVRSAEFRAAFVLMQYFGYLHRDPDPAGYDFWLGKLNNHGGDYISSEMIRSFLVSTEYRARFGSP